MWKTGGEIPRGTFTGLFSGDFAGPPKQQTFSGIFPDFCRECLSVLPSLRNLSGPLLGDFGPGSRCAWGLMPEL